MAKVAAFNGNGIESMLDVLARELNERARKRVRTGEEGRLRHARLDAYRRTLVGGLFQSGPERLGFAIGYRLSETDAANLVFDDVALVVVGTSGGYNEHARLTQDLDALKCAFDAMCESDSLDRQEVQILFDERGEEILTGFVDVVERELAIRNAAHK